MQCLYVCAAQLLSPFRCPVRDSQSTYIPRVRRKGRLEGFCEGLYTMQNAGQHQRVTPAFIRINAQRALDVVAQIPANILAAAAAVPAHVPQPEKAFALVKDDETEDGDVVYHTPLAPADASDTASYRETQWVTKPEWRPLARVISCSRWYGGGVEATTTIVPSGQGISIPTASRMDHRREGALARHA